MKILACRQMRKKESEGRPRECECDALQEERTSTL